MLLVLRFIIILCNNYYKWNAIFDNCVTSISNISILSTFVKRRFTKNIKYLLCHDTFFYKFPPKIGVLSS